MKAIKLGGLAATLLLAGLTQSCATDDPFGSDGDGVLRMKMVINSDVTRAEQDEDALRSSCIVYISSEKGLIQKYKGLENLPEQLTLKNGHYVIEAWAGDSVSASYDKKFYSAYEPVDITSGVNQVVVNCKIANVVVSVNQATIDPAMMKDWNIRVENSRAGLDFNADNLDAKGYFMMPNADIELKYTVTGTNMAGQAFSHSGVISNPKRAHEYQLNVGYNPDYQEEGGSFITITVDDSEVLVEDEVQLFSRPAVKGVGYDIDKQITGNAGAFGDKMVKVTAFGGITQLHLKTAETGVMTYLNGDTDLKNMTEAVAQEIKDAGITWDEKYNAERNLATSYITLSAAFFNALPERDTEYVMTLSVTDKYGKTTDQNIRIAVGEGAIVIDDPVTADAVDTSDLMAVLSTKATLTGSIVDATAANPGIRVREAGSDGAWTVYLASEAAVARQARRHLTPAQATRAGGSPFTVNVKNLKPGTRYEYQACADGFNSESMYFTTEGTFTIPNAGMEEWSQYSAKTMLGTKQIWIPWSVGDKEASFWGSGNEGAATANGQITFQNSDTAFINSGNSSIKLASKSVFGVIAAGNVFVGKYDKTDGTDGVLQLGRAFDGSHPDKLSVYVSYTPGGGVTVKKGEEGNVGVTAGGTDHGQIYVALSTAPIEIRTKASNRKLFPTKAGDPQYDDIIAYGEQTWTETFSGDKLTKVEIPLTYRANAKTKKPLYLIITCCATKYGDFYSGSASSIMYLDDFSLIYE